MAAARPISSRPSRRPCGMRHHCHTPATVNSVPRAAATSTAERRADRSLGMTGSRYRRVLGALRADALSHPTDPLMAGAHRLAQERGHMVAEADRGRSAILAFTARLARLPRLARRLALPFRPRLPGGRFLPGRAGAPLLPRRLLVPQPGSVRLGAGMGGGGLAGAVRPVLLRSALRPSGAALRRSAWRRLAPALAVAPRACADSAGGTAPAAPPARCARHVLRAGRRADPGDGRAQHALDVLELLDVVAGDDRQRAA